MTVFGVIPARYGSTRFPGKPLQLIYGKPLLQWVIEGSKTAKKIDKIIVATDDQRIAELAKACGVEVVITDPNLPSGTDRVWAAVKNQICDVVLNIQGDEPLIEGPVLDKLVGAFAGPNIQMATLGKSLSEEDLTNPNCAKIVLNNKNEALYFSRLAIPFSRQPLKQGISLKHIGIYAFQKSFLEKFCHQGVVDLELSESLEQLRALYMGAKIKVVQVEHESWGVDTPADVAQVESKLKNRGANE